LILKVHQNTTDYSFFVDVSVAVRDRHHQKKPVPVLASSSDEGLW